MNYLNTMGNLLSLGQTFSLNTEKEVKQLQLYCIINVLVLGLIYGSSAALFSRILLGESGFNPGSADMAKVIIAGIPVAFFIHAGAALFIWVFLKALGGKADFMSAYFHLGAAAISLWPLAPFAAVLQAGMSSPPLTLSAGLLSIYAFAVNVKLIQTAFALSALRMTLATSGTVIYISCFLYLWM